jgi:putative lipoprotein
LLLLFAGCTHAPPPESEAPFPAITGHVFYRERVALDPNAQVELELADVSRADAPAIPVANQNIKAAGRNVPIAFDLRYDPAAIDRRHTYAVRARITFDGRVIWRGDPVPVLTHGAGDTAEILLRAADD